MNRGNTNVGAYVVQMAGATNVTLEDLELTGGSYGMYAPAGAGSTGLMVSNSALFANENAGAFVDTGNNGASFINDTVFGIPDQLTEAQDVGIQINAANALVTGSTVYDSSSVGLALTGAAAVASGNTAYGNAYGISLSGPGSTVSGNTVFDSTSSGIAATGSIVVSGNTVYGQTGNATGISLTEGRQPRQDNTVYGNTTGISDTYGGLVSNNRVYDNSSVGITATTGIPRSRGTTSTATQSAWTWGRTIRGRCRITSWRGTRQRGFTTMRRPMPAHRIWTITRSTRRLVMAFRSMGAPRTRSC